MSEHDAFRKFIEEELDLSGLPSIDTSEDPLANLDAGRKMYGLIVPSLNDAKLEQDIQQIWNALQQEKPGKSYWRHYLTPLEQGTREILQDLLLAALRRNITDQLDDRHLRSVIAYSMTMGWLVIASLLSKYDDPDDIQPLF